ncbi:MAG: efflux RND transporter periplasmic adaptor subunit [Saprospiraceae bacterium]|nr:efflux RND transporter periplasmic adaptor subunit [Saprospiraceae bacterium]
MKNKDLLQILTFGAVVALLSACGGGSPDPAVQLAALKDQKAQIEAEIAALEKVVGNTNGAERRVKVVGLSEMNPTVFRHYIDLQGRVDAEENVPVTAKMPGTLTRVLVKNGDQVKKGQLLAQVDDGVMLKSLAELESQLKTAEDIYNRQKGLWEQKIGTEVQFIQAKSQKESLENAIATMKENWGQTKIYAPISGTVDMVILKVGQAISPGVPLCNIINLSQLKVVGNVTEAYAAKVRKGDQVTVFFPDLKKEISTRVTYVSKTIDPNTRTFAVECALPGSPDYRANMVAVMKIIDYQNPSALVVPVNLIQTAEDGDFVMVAEKNGEKQATAKKAAVKQGSNYNGMVEIASGLKKGDFVISTGFQDVNNGETVAF